MNMLRTLRTPFVQIGKDVVQVTACARRIPYNHRPCLFHKASISLSGTNSPLRACSKPSRMAVRVSSSSSMGAFSDSVIKSVAKASCSASGSSRTFSIAFSSNLVMFPLYHKRRFSPRYCVVELCLKYLSKNSCACCCQVLARWALSCTWV